MQFLLMLVSLFISGSFAANIPKSKWVIAYQRELIREVCSDSVHLNQCYGKSPLQCKKGIRIGLDHCVKKVRIPTRIATSDHSIRLGERLGLCIGEYLKDDWQVKGSKKCQK